MRRLSKRRVPTRRCRGFTLVELLVGLSLLAVISVLLFGGLRFGVRAWEAGDREIGIAGSIERARSLLRRQLSQTRPPAIITEAGSVRVTPTLRGTGSGLVFVAPLPAHRGFGGLHLFSLSTEPGGAGDQLVLTWSPFDPRAGAGIQDPNDRVVLLDRVATVEVGYFDRPAANLPARWLDRWEVVDGLPALVRIRVELEGDAAGGWPDLYVAPRLGRTGT